MPDYEFYRKVYGGAVIGDAAGFDAVAGAAEARLCGYERSYTVCYPAPDSRCKAVCAIADEMALTRRALDEAEGRVTSVRVGDVSTGYAALDPAAFAQGAEGRYYRAAMVYADIYRGALAPGLARGPRGVRGRKTARPGDADGEGGGAP